MIDRQTIEPNSSKKKAALSNILSSNKRPKIYKKGISRSNKLLKSQVQESEKTGYITVSYSRPKSF